jgi:hypothetical protein
MEIDGVSEKEYLLAIELKKKCFQVRAAITTKAVFLQKFCANRRLELEDP